MNLDWQQMMHLLGHLPLNQRIIFLFVCFLLFTGGFYALYYRHIAETIDLNNHNISILNHQIAKKSHDLQRLSATTKNHEKTHALAQIYLPPPNEHHVFRNNCHPIDG